LNHIAPWFLLALFDLHIDGVIDLRRGR